MLYSFAEAAKLLGGISHWTLRKHAAIGQMRVVHIGRRVFLDAEELERIQRDGLPSLAQPHLENPMSKNGTENG
jgi:hypothetical protein